MPPNTWRQTLYCQILAGAEAAGLSVDGAIELRVRQLVSRQPLFRYFRAPPDSAMDASGSFSLQSAGTSWQGEILASDRPVVRREPYDEAPLAARATQIGRAIEVLGMTKMQPFEIVTALNLLLHQRLFTLPEHRKWYLARIELERPLRPDDARRVRIELARVLGRVMTRALILTNGEYIGQLEYMAGPI